MRIIKRVEPIAHKKMIECECCKSVFEFFKSECNVTSGFEVTFDGLGEYNIACPVCGRRNYFNWK